MSRRTYYAAFLCWVLVVAMPNELTQAKKMLLGGMNTPMGASNDKTITLAQLTRIRAQKIYYENTIKEIIQADCGRCHSGPTRNLTDYDNLKAYADGGLLATMIQGPMRRFAGNDAAIILNWIQNGAPEKPPAGAPARYSRVPGTNSPVCQSPGTVTPLRDAPGGQITYHGTIRQILNKDCLRCHSGPFRNLTTYKNVRMYVDNGLLKTLVMPGGPMHRFAGPDTRMIVAWINSGAPE